MMKSSILLASLVVALFVWPTTTFSQVRGTAPKASVPPRPTRPITQDPATGFRSAVKQNALFQDQLSPPVSGTIYSPNGYYKPVRFGPTQAERKLMSEIKKYTDAVVQAVDSRSEEMATKDLRESLGKLFDERIKRREKEIEALEQRLEDLKTKNKERKRKKDEIVELKLKSVVNEARGFGF